MPDKTNSPHDENNLVPPMDVENMAANMPHVKQMQELIDKYSSLVKHVPQPRTYTGEYVLVTGVTGGIGSHVAAQLAIRDNVKKVYCLVRANSPKHARQRVLDELEARRVGAVYDKFSPKALDKLQAYASDMAKPDLGLSPEVLEELKSTVTCVIHGAWIINFMLPLTAYAENLAATQNLINLCLSTRSPTPASFNFLSSYGSVALMPMFIPPDPTTGIISVPEVMPPTLATTDPNQGYGQSKLIAEFICERAAAANPSLTTRAIRIGQVVGDAVTGIWNPRENIPRMWQTALLVGALPDQEIHTRMLPVDECAGTIADLSLPPPPDDTNNKQPVPGGVFHLLGPHPILWNKDLLSMLHKLGLPFDIVPHAEWLARLHALPQDTKRFPPLKLLPVWAMWEQQRRGDKSDKSDSLSKRNIVSPFVDWQTKRTQQYSPTFRALGPPDLKLVGAQLRWLMSEGWERDVKGQGRGGAAAGSKAMAKI
ncbi:male sterility protein-domain-containing protein [Phyllosticta citrichinensis]|uniref:Male sterility protein-domain-containing protein n=1 Tax=Phyllosticta citrichinensis TaxID=1130410 RepID=A0ABR1XUJ2_9PEZI